MLSCFTGTSGSRNPSPLLPGTCVSRAPPPPARPFPETPYPSLLRLCFSHVFHSTFLSFSFVFLLFFLRVFRFSYAFPLLFTCCSCASPVLVWCFSNAVLVLFLHAFPLVFQCFSFVFRVLFLCFPCVFLCFSCALAMLFFWLSHAFPVLRKVWRKAWLPKSKSTAFHDHLIPGKFWKTWRPPEEPLVPESLKVHEPGNNPSNQGITQLTASAWPFPMPVRFSRMFVWHGWYFLIYF